MIDAFASQLTSSFSLECFSVSNSPSRPSAASLDEVKDLNKANSRCSSRAAGLDKAINLLSPIHPLLMQLFNDMIAESYFPVALKVGHTILVHGNKGENTCHSS
ncbi:hypothetical protein Ciccas_008894 [Cichlidogyrus casuarinus]|uniref:Uncharacterized protein n=1 Tax=Cichlidogyrus casuarinus TaxID=1844966 RepID=A0ABD2PYL0_9PLAT